MQKTNQNAHDEDAGKGAIEQDSPDEKTNVSTTGQNGHRGQDPLLNPSGSDFPEPGENEEHTGEPREEGVNPEGVNQDQDPGFRQKENQNKSKDDPLAA